MPKHHAYPHATYCEYLDKNPLTGELYSPCGDRAIIRLDKRLTTTNAARVARDNNGVNRPHYAAYQLFTGELNRPNYAPITDIIALTAKTED